MQYLGSKNRIAKLILPIILKDRKSDQWYVEPFVGGCNIIDKVDGPRIGNDSNKYLIHMWKMLQNGWIPPTKITKAEYYAIKQNPQLYPMELVSFVAFLCSFGAKWFGGYAFNSKADNYAARGSRCLLKQIESLKDVIFSNEDYRNLSVPENSIIYCDPPYANSTQYKDSFNHEEFWEWVRIKSVTNKIYVSEYAAPKDFTCLLEIPYKTILDKNSNYLRVEKLFTLGSGSVWPRACALGA
jgi:DNA adenine methylase